MSLDRALGHGELLGDLLVARTGTQLGHDRALSRGEALEPAVDTRGAQARRRPDSHGEGAQLVEQVRGELSSDPDLATLDGLQGLAEQGGRDRAVAVPEHSHLEGGEAFPLVRPTRENDDLRCGLQPSQSGHASHSPKVWQSKVEEENGRRLGRQAAQELSVVDDLDGGKGLRTLPPALANGRDGAGNQNDGRRPGDGLAPWTVAQSIALEPNSQMPIGKRRGSHVVQDGYRHVTDDEQSA